MHIFTVITIFIYLIDEIVAWLNSMAPAIAVVSFYASRADLVVGTIVIQVGRLIFFYLKESDIMSIRVRERL